MHDSEPVFGPILGPRVMEQKGIDQRPKPPARPGMDEQAAGLVDYRQVGVGVKDVKGMNCGSIGSGGGISTSASTRSPGEGCAGFLEPAVDPDLVLSTNRWNWARVNSRTWRQRKTSRRTPPRNRP